MKKDFDGWNKRKKQLHNQTPAFFYYEREIWWCSLGVNIGNEQDGVNELFERPVLILKKFNSQILWIIPLTTSDKSSYFYFKSKDFSSVILSQIRLISSRRLLRKIGTINYEDFREIIRKVKKIFPET